MATEPPAVPGLPIIGNLRDIDPEIPIESLANLADQYGPIYKFSIFSTTSVVISSAEYMAEVCDEKRFSKIVSRGLGEVRNGLNDGEFWYKYT